VADGGLGLDLGARFHDRARVGVDGIDDAVASREDGQGVDERDNARERPAAEPPVFSR